MRKQQRKKSLDLKEVRAFKTSISGCSEWVQVPGAFQVHTGAGKRGKKQETGGRKRDLMGGIKGLQGRRNPQNRSQNQFELGESVVPGRRN